MACSHIAVGPLLANLMIVLPPGYPSISQSIAGLMMPEVVGGYDCGQ